MVITSLTNAKVKAIIKLQKNSRERTKQDVFLVEGVRMVREIPVEDCVELYMSEHFLEHSSEAKILEEKFGQSANVIYVSDAVMKVMSDTETPQGILAVVKQRHLKLADVIASQKNPMLIVLENIQDPGNLGTIMRTAEGAGVTGVIMSKDTVDIYNPKTVRSTMGAIFRVPFIIENDMIALTKKLNEHGIMTCGGHLDGSDFYGMDYSKSVAFYIGNEGNGLTDALSDALSVKIKIPMKGAVESLNAATAATVMMYEAMRQRL